MSYPPIPSIYPYAPPPFIAPPNATTNNDSKNNFDRPITTVFIGSISEKIPDDLMKEILTKCGNVLSWKRVQGASKLQAFGFCEYDNPEATLRCIRLLNDFKIADKALVVKVDPKTDELLTEYKSKKKETIENREADDVTKTEDAKKERIASIYAKETEEDKTVLKQIKKLIIDSGHEISNDETIHKKYSKSRKRELSIDEVDPEKKQIISKEIESFRNKHKDEDIIEDEERYKRIRERENERRREKEMEKPSDKHRRHRNKRSKSKSKSNYEMEFKKKSRESSKNQHRSGSKETHRSSHKSKRDNQEDYDEYETNMLKKIKRKLHEKESAYKLRFQRWEKREKEKIEEYEHEIEKKNQKDKEVAEEARKLQIFFEDYDDEKLDSRYYRGAELERRLNSRKLEEIADEKDRSKEIEQIENTRERLIKEQNPDVEDIISKMEQSMQEHLKKKFVNIELALPINKPLEPSKNEIEIASNEYLQNEEEPCKLDDTFQSTNNLNQESLESDITLENDKSVKSDVVDQVEVKPQISISDRKQMVKQIIDNIPTVKIDLFAYSIDWSMVDEAFVDSRIKPWVKKKIVGYIGEDEPSLSQFICEQVLEHKSPDQILADIAMVLEEEADVFVMKMWRLLIYVIEERKAGLDN